MTSAQTNRLWKYPEGTIPNSIAFVYAVLGQMLGLYWIISAHAFVVIVGMLLTAHTLIIGAYLVHECGHLTLFRSKKVNNRVATVLLWLQGAAYASFERIQHMHFRHHRDRADVSRFDHQAFIQQTPAWVQKLIYALEWAYIPAVELIMHAQVMVKPFIEPALHSERKRVILVWLSRAAFYGALFWFSPWAPLAYALAYCLFLHGLFLGDAFAHTYDVFVVTDPAEPVPMEHRDKQYDIDHTYSNLISTRWPLLNLWNLNFGYHTAHHVRSSTPWYDLPRLHHKTFGRDHVQVLPFKELMKTLHHNRTRRILVSDYGDVGEGPGRADNFIGAHGVSFLSIV